MFRKDVWTARAVIVLAVALVYGIARLAGCGT